MRLWVHLALLLVGRVGAGWASPADWRVEIPTGWHQVQAAPDETLVIQLVPDDVGRHCSVTVRCYSKAVTSLEDEFRQLRYSVITRLEGRILGRESCQVAGRPALKVIYDGRSPGGDIKKYMRYLLIRDEELVTVHCVLDQEQRDVQELGALIQTLTCSPTPTGPSPE